MEGFIPKDEIAAAEYGRTGAPPHEPFHRGFPTSELCDLCAYWSSARARDMTWEEYSAELPPEFRMPDPRTEGP
jgi:hypothetical protein